MSNDEINKLQKQLNNTTNQNNRNNIQDKINLFRKNNNLIVLNLKENKNILNEYRAKQNDLEDDIINMAFRLIYGLSILPNTYEECIKIANKYEIGGNFIEIGLAAIGNYQCNNIEDALYYANEYFVQESYNPQVKHPIIDGLFLVILIENEAYESAKVIIEDLVEYYPESVKLHELIQKVHLGLHEYSEAALERKIIKLLT